jgi:hypothetical protein
MKQLSIGMMCVLFGSGMLGCEPGMSDRETLAEAAPVEHVIVWKEAGRFGGWPANHGMWSWGDEIVVGFRAAHFKKVERGHAVDGDKPSEEWQARSLDGGRTWSIEKPPSIVPPRLGGPEPTECPGNLDFTHPDFALMFRMTSAHAGTSRFYYSNDRARTWQGPYSLPNFGQPGIAARTDYIVNGPHDLMIFVTAAKQNEREGRVMTARTTDGGATWAFVSWIGPEPEGFAIMPASLRLSPTRILTLLRCRERERRWIEAWTSDDNGQTWQFLNKPALESGDEDERLEHRGRDAPPSLLMLQDRRLALIYNYRSPPFGIRAKLSLDNGQTWSDEMILRDDGGNWDLGYVRSVQRPDGKIVSVYYYNDDPDEERYIAATIWDPGEGKGLGFQP